MNLKIVQQENKFNIENFDKLTADHLDNEGSSKHGDLLPNTVRCIITGPSNCGKTNVVFNLLTQFNGLRFNNVYVFSKSLNQPKYKLLERVMRGVDEVGFYQYNNGDDVMEPNKAKPYSIFIFDDISCEKQDTIKNYFSMGRHNKIDSIYLGQTYSKIPKQLIRDNVNLIVIFKQDEKNLKHIYKDHVEGDMMFEEFKKLSENAWKEKHGFIVVSKDHLLNKGRYRIGFDKYILLQ